MDKLLKEFISYITEANKPLSAADQAKKSGYKHIRGSQGFWSTSGKPPAEATTRGQKFRVLTQKEKQTLSKGTPDTVSPTRTQTPTHFTSSLPGGRGVMDAIVGVTTTGSAGAGIPESRAAEASVVLISTRLLQGRKKFKGDMDSYLKNNDALINEMLAQLSHLKGSKLTDDWKGSVKAQIIASLSQTEKIYGKLDLLVWDNTEGRAALGLPKQKDMNDRSDMYFKTTNGQIIGVSLKKDGNIFLANQGYRKIITKIETFAKDAQTKTKIQKLKKLHKEAADQAFQEMFQFIKKNKNTVISALSTFNRTGIKSLSSEKYDQYFLPSGKLNKKFLDIIRTQDTLSTSEKTPEFKTLLKCLDGVKKENSQIAEVIKRLRMVDIIATKQFLHAVESNSNIREATTQYLLDALDIPQMISLNPSEGITHAVTVYGEGNIDKNGNTSPMYVNGETLRETFGISKSTSQSDALEELRTRFIIDAESDKRVGIIRLRITNKTPPPNYYYPTIATLAVRARGFGSAAAFELYQHDAWTNTLASKSPNPADWTPQQRKKQAESTIKFLNGQIKNPLVSKREKEQLQKDITFYSTLL